MFRTVSFPAAMRRFASPAVLLLLLGMPGCGGPELASRWAGPGLTVDGKLDDWGSTLTYFDEQRVTLGIRNDDRYLYLCVNSTDTSLLMRALVQGLEVWVDPKGGQARTFGIRYPLGVREMDFDIGHEGRRFEPGELARKYAGAPDELRVFIGPDKSHLAKPGEGGIQVAMGRRADDLSCELRIPLSVSEGEPLAIGARPGAMIGIGFVIPEAGRGGFRGPMASPPDDRPRGDDGGGEPGGDEGDGGGSDRGSPDSGRPDGAPGSEHGPGGRGDRMARGSMTTESLDLWVKVRLAEKPAAIQ
jgi:hypothetical protein